MPKISVIIPMFNSEEFIRRCIVSIEKQTLKDIEVIIVDDCSKDNSYNIAKLAIDESKLSGKVIRNKINQGPGFSRNIGINACKGDYVLFLDSDDWIKEDCLEKLYNAIIRENADFVICDYYKAYTNGIEKKCVDLSFHEGFIEPEIYTSLCNDGVTRKLIKKALFVDNNIEFPKWNNGEDIYVAILIGFYSKKIYYLNDYLYYYFQRQNSTSNEGIKDIYFYQKLFALYKNHHLKFDLDSKYLSNRLISDLIYNQIIVFLKVHKSNKFIKEYLNKTKSDYRQLISEKDLEYYGLLKKIFISVCLINIPILLKFLYFVKEKLERNG